MKTLTSFARCSALLRLSAQTEVRRAVVLPSYKDLKYPPLPPLKVPEPTEIHALQWHEGFAAGGSRTAADQRRGADPHRQSFRSGGQARAGRNDRRSAALGRHAKAQTGDQLDQDLENVAASVESQIGET